MNLIEKQFVVLLKEYKIGNLTEGVIIDWLQKHRKYVGLRKMLKLEQDG